MVKNVQRYHVITSYSIHYTKLYEFVFFSFIFLISLYKKYEKIKFFLNYIVAKKLYFFSGLYTDKIFYEYFLCMESLLNNGYKFHDSFTNSKVLIKNYFVLDRITQIENLLKSGKSIEYSLEQSKFVITSYSIHYTKLYDQIILIVLKNTLYSFHFLISFQSE